ncbi:hypothetical protein [Sphaerisporangium sp. NPDC051011]|uniref:hypothetical protein n=1 Tax=Sphaerisporangium sp. NPDC051011 TaxID=3155792 RepID=UPI0033CB0C49
MESAKIDRKSDPEWYGVRCVFHHRDLGAYEERITIWRAANFSEAIRLAESEAIQYAITLIDVRYVGLSQAYHISDDLDEGVEVFSLMRTSNLAPSEYVDTFFSEGGERQRTQP